MITMNGYKKNVPHIFKGASNSNSIGWLRKISLDFKHKPRTSASASCTLLPGLPRAVKNELHERFVQLKNIY